jgi:hypothetical protein
VELEELVAAEQEVRILILVAVAELVAILVQAELVVSI